jgi:hypothetical protein
MGHYDDQRDAWEDAQEASAASAAGMGVAAYRVLEIHKAKMKRGRQLHDVRQENDHAITYYKEHTE